jgi:hypothetical protein
MKLFYGSCIPTVAIIWWLTSSQTVAAAPALLRHHANVIQDQNERMLGGCDMSIAGVKRDCIKDEASLC